MFQNRCKQNEKYLEMSLFFIVTEYFLWRGRASFGRLVVIGTSHSDLCG